MRIPSNQARDFFGRQSFRAFVERARGEARLSFVAWLLVGIVPSLVGRSDVHARLRSLDANDHPEYYTGKQDAARHLTAGVTWATATAAQRTTAIEAAAAAAGNWGCIVIPAGVVSCNMVTFTQYGLRVELLGDLIVPGTQTAGLRFHARHQSLICNGGGLWGQVGDAATRTNAIEIGKSDNSAPAHYFTAWGPKILPSFDGHGIIVYHGIEARIIAPDMEQASGGDIPQATPGGVFGVNGSKKAIYVVNQASSQNNVVFIEAPIIAAWSEEGIYFSNVEGGTVLGGTVQACGGSQIYLTNGDNNRVVNTYTESTVAGVPNVTIDTEADTHVDLAAASTVAAANGKVILTGSCSRIVIERFTGGTIEIGASCEDTTLIRPVYGNVAGATIVDNGVGTRIVGPMRNASNENFHRAVLDVSGSLNLHPNGGMERWNSASDCIGYSASAVTLARIGDGEAITDKQHGTYAMRVRPVAGNGTAGVTLVNTSTGLGPYSHADLIGKRVTFRLRYKRAAGALGVVVRALYNTGAADYVSPETTDATWRTLSGTFKIRTGTTNVAIALLTNLGEVDDTMDVYLDDLTVGVGEAVPDWFEAPLREDATGKLGVDYVPDLDAAKIASGTFAGARIPAITNAMVDAAAAIAKSKLAALAIADADVAAGAAIAKSKLAALAVVDADVAAGAAISGDKIVAAAAGVRGTVLKAATVAAVGAMATPDAPAVYTEGGAQTELDKLKANDDELKTKLDAALSALKAAGLMA